MLLSSRLAQQFEFTLFNAMTVFKAKDCQIVMDNLMETTCSLFLENIRKWNSNCRAPQDDNRISSFMKQTPNEDGLSKLRLCWSIESPTQMLKRDPLNPSKFFSRSNHKTPQKQKIPFRTETPYSDMISPLKITKL